jgi:hypothetical protein
MILTDTALALLAFGLQRVAQLFGFGLRGSLRLRGSLGIGLLAGVFCLLFARCGFVPGRLVGVHVYRGSNDQQLSDAFCSLDRDASTL